jgi:archaemetzincin
MEDDKHAEYTPPETSKATLTIIIQPFVGFPASSANLIAKQLKEMYSGNIVVNDAIPFPDNAFYAARSRYRADSLIKYLSSLAKDGQLIIGLTNRDISTTKDNYPDWGIMGLGYCPGKSCIASTFRLKGGNPLEKLFKVAIHELGHTQGLPHCPNQTCLMRDAEGKDHLDEEKEFCPRCKAVLIKAGWNLK